MSEQIIVPGLEPQTLQAAVTVHNGQAVLHFSEPREFVALSGGEPLMLGARLLLAGVEANGDHAQAAIVAAMAVIDAVYELRGDIKPAGGAVKHELIERHRKTLCARLRVVLNSTREKKTVNNASLARKVVDIMLHEVFA